MKIDKDIRKELIKIIYEALYDFSLSFDKYMDTVGLYKKTFCMYFLRKFDLNIYFDGKQINKYKILTLEECLYLLLVECREELFPDIYIDPNIHWFDKRQTQERISILKLALKKLKDED